MRRVSEEEKFALGVCLELLDELISNRKQYSVTPRALISLTKVYYALSAYPNCVIDDLMELSASTRWEGGGLDYSSLTVDSDYFELMKGGSVYTEGVGSDSFTSFYYSSNALYDQLDFESQVESWKESFISHLSDTTPKLNITDYATVLETETNENEEEEELK